MPELKISKRADPGFVEAFRKLVGRLARSAGATSRDPIVMILAGGAAIHFHTGWRPTDDVDAVYSKKLLIPADAAVIYRDAEGNARSVHFDPTYNETYALMHANSHHDAWKLAAEGLDGIRIMVLQPLDLAVSKLARFGEIDRKDILNLARAGLITQTALRKRANEALPGYAGDPIPVRNSLEMVCREIRALKRGARRRPADA